MCYSHVSGEKGTTSKDNGINSFAGQEFGLSIYKRHTPPPSIKQTNLVSKDLVLQGKL